MSNTSNVVYYMQYVLLLFKNIYLQL